MKKWRNKMKDPVLVLPPNKVPPRSSLSHESLSIIGIPRKFHDIHLEDFKTYNNKGLEELRNFVEEYLVDIAYRDRQSYQEGIPCYGRNGVGKIM